jgi:hypothetical protein
VIDGTTGAWFRGCTRCTRKAHRTARRDDARTTVTREVIGRSQRRIGAAVQDGRRGPAARHHVFKKVWESRERQKDGGEVEDRVRKVDVEQRIVHARIDPTWADPGHPSPLSVPWRPCPPGSPASGTARVPAPQRKPGAIRRERKRPRCGVSASASANPFSTCVRSTRHPPTIHRLL